MRKDMAKRFLKHGKHSKGRFPRNCKNLSMKDEDGQNVYNPHGMRSVHHYTIKYEDRGYLGTDSALLHRFLQSRTGQPWDQVYSEICKETDDRSFEGHHLREYLDYEVEQSCTINKDGEVLDQRGLHVARFWGEFYVHPKTGNLEYIEKKRWRIPKTPHTVFEMNGRFYHEHEGIWYRVEMIEVPSPADRFEYWPSSLTDAFLSNDFAIHFCNVENTLRAKYGRSPNGNCWYCDKKQSANSKEITKLKKKQAA